MKPASSPTESAQKGRPLPRGPHALSSEDVARSQRDRLTEAMVTVVARQGYQAATVAAIIALAGVSRRTFYEHFTDREDCFLAALDDGTKLLVSELVARIESESDREQRIEQAVRAVCDAFAARPLFTRTFLLLVPEAGEKAQARRREQRDFAVATIRSIVETARRNEGLVLPVSDAQARAVLGAVEAHIIHHLEVASAETLPDLVPMLAQIADVLLKANIPDPV